MTWLLFFRDEHNDTSKTCTNSSKKTRFCIFIILCSLLITPTISQGGKELCIDGDCTCDANGEADLIDVICRCSPKKVSNAIPQVFIGLY